MSDLDKLLGKGRKITLKMPGCTSNLGAGLDCLGLALNIYSRMSFFLLPANDPGIPLISYRGAIDKSSLAQDQGKLTYTILSRLWQRDHHILERVRIIVDSDIPLGVGLGSSATAILGALWAASVLQDRIPTTATLLAEAREMEGHAESLAASLLGGLVVCGQSNDGKRIVTQRLNWPKDWHVIVVSPWYSLTTAMSRSVLPKNVKLSDAQHNVGKVAQLVAAIARNDEVALRESFDDRLHEPYRSQLVPELNQLRQLLVGSPIMGCALSGGGSSICIFVNAKKKSQVLETITDWADQQERPPKVLDLQVDDQGIQELEI